VVVGLGAYTYSFYTKVKDNETQLLKDKELIQAELEEEIVRYTRLLEEKSILMSELSVAKERLEAFQKRIDSNEVTRSIVQQYQMELRQLRKERELLFRQNDSLQQETTRLSDLQRRTQNSLDSITKQREQTQRESLVPEIVKPAVSKITLSNIQAQGVIQRNSGKFVNTSRAVRAQMIRLCYQVDENNKIPVSEFSFYVKVLNQNNKLIGIERTKTLETGEKILYNTETTIAYKQKPYKVCELVLPIASFSKGIYTIQIYSEQGMLSSTNLTLK
jgi:hypothetical protein